MSNAPGLTCQNCIYSIVSKPGKNIKNYEAQTKFIFNKQNYSFDLSYNKEIYYLSYHKLYKLQLAEY